MAGTRISEKGGDRGKKRPKQDMGGTSAQSGMDRTMEGTQIDPLSGAMWDLYNLFFPSAEAGTGGETVAEKGATGGSKLAPGGRTSAEAATQSTPGARPPIPPRAPMTPMPAPGPMPAPQSGPQNQSMMAQPTQVAPAMDTSLADAFGQAFASPMYTPPMPQPNPQRVMGTGGYAPPQPATPMAMPAARPPAPMRNPVFDNSGIQSNGQDDRYGDEDMFNAFVRSLVQTAGM